MASQLASRGYRTSFLNPSDCIAVIQGCLGYWWACGMGERYVGEEGSPTLQASLSAPPPEEYYKAMWL